jgi:hypothetical protein
MRIVQSAWSMGQSAWSMVINNGESCQRQMRKAHCQLDKFGRAWLRRVGHFDFRFTNLDL